MASLQCGVHISPQIWTMTKTLGAFYGPIHENLPGPNLPGLNVPHPSFFLVLNLPITVQSRHEWEKRFLITEIFETVLPDTFLFPGKM